MDRQIQEVREVGLIDSIQKLIKVGVGESEESRLISRLCVQRIGLAYGAAIYRAEKIRGIFGRGGDYLNFKHVAFEVSMENVGLEL